MRDISRNLLIVNNWEYHRGAVDEDDYFTISICDNQYHLECCPFANMLSRNWHIHVDNEAYMTIGGCDIQNTEHFNAFMKLLDIPYELH